MDEEFIKFLGRATAYLFMLSLAALSAGIDKIKKRRAKRNGRNTDRHNTGTVGSTKEKQNDNH